MLNVGRNGSILARPDTLSYLGLYGFDVSFRRENVDIISVLKPGYGRTHPINPLKSIH